METRRPISLFSIQSLSPDMVTEWSRPFICRRLRQSMNVASEWIVRSLIRATLAVPDTWLVWWLKDRRQPYRDQSLHPRIQFGLELVERIGLPKQHRLSPPEARQHSKGFSDLLDIRKTQLPIVEDTTVPGPGGPIAVRVYRPTRSRERCPVVLFLHGGGFVLGDVEGYDHPCRKLAKSSKAVVVSVEYRLAPEHPFPAGLEDCWAVFEWLRTQGETWDLDSEHITLAGDSAGGNLAAVIAQLARDAGGIQPVLQVLIYPRVDSANMSTSAIELKDRNLVLTEELMTWFREHYLQNEEDVRDFRLSPLLNPNLSDLPPAIVITCGFDPLWDEAAAYADAIESQGVAVERIHMPDMIHGAWSLGGFLKSVRKLHRHVANQIKAAHKDELSLSPEVQAIAS